MTIKELREAISHLDDDDFVYATDCNGTPLDILYVDDGTSIGFWELKLADSCEFFPQYNKHQASNTQSNSAIFKG